MPKQDKKEKKALLDFFKHIHARTFNQDSSDIIVIYAQEKVISIALKVQNTGVNYWFKSNPSHTPAQSRRCYWPSEQKSCVSMFSASPQMNTSWELYILSFHCLQGQSHSTIQDHCGLHNCTVNFHRTSDSVLLIIYPSRSQAPHFNKVKYHGIATLGIFFKRFWKFFIESNFSHAYLS